MLVGQMSSIKNVLRSPSPLDFEKELITIADWWLDKAIDHDNEGFIGEVTFRGEPNSNSHKGIVLNTRILWFFSEVAQHTGNDAHLEAAHKAFRYICDHFVDNEHGGVFWEVSAKGHCVNSRKQIYAQAFAIYAFSAYYALTKSMPALVLAWNIFFLVEKYGFDNKKGGYHEAFSRKWGALDDIRLSPKDLNSPKTMNTHLHILEAYTALYAVNNDAKVASALRSVLGYYGKYFVDPQTQHLKMFLDIDWQDQSQAYSYGHDIESSWLIWEAVQALGDKDIEDDFRTIVLRLAESCLENGVEKDGSVCDAFDFSRQKNIVERIWWIQAEAMIGFFNIYQMTNNDAYFSAAMDVWEYIQAEIIDRKHGEWHWLAKSDQDVNYSECKAGFWKGPYHNGRAMLEMYRRLSFMSDSHKRS